MDNNTQPAAAALDELMKTWGEDLILEQRIATLQAQRKELAEKMRVLKQKVLLKPPAALPPQKSAPPPSRRPARRLNHQPSVLDRVTDVVRGLSGMFTIDEVIEQAQIPLPQARGCIATLMRFRAIRRVGVGQYELTGALAAGQPAQAPGAPATA